MAHVSFLPEALNEAQKFARSQSTSGFHDWGSFIIPTPNPAIRGIWRNVIPGVQFLVLEAFPCTGTRTLAPIVRPIGIRLLKGMSRIHILNGRGGIDDAETVTVSAGSTTCLSLPGTRFLVDPVNESCIMLVIRLRCFPRATSPETWAITQSLDEATLSTFKQEVGRLLAS